MSDIVREDRSQSHGAMIISRLFRHAATVVSAKHAKMVQDNENARVTKAEVHITAKVLPFRRTPKKYCVQCGSRIEPDSDLCVSCCIGDAV